MHAVLLTSFKIWHTSTAQFSNSYKMLQFYHNTIPASCEAEQQMHSLSTSYSFSVRRCVFLSIPHCWPETDKKLISTNTNRTDSINTHKFKDTLHSMNKIFGSNFNSLTSSARSVTLKCRRKLERGNVLVIVPGRMSGGGNVRGGFNVM